MATKFVANSLVFLAASASQSLPVPGRPHLAFRMADAHFAVNVPLSRRLAFLVAAPAVSSLYFDRKHGSTVIRRGLGHHSSCRTSEFAFRCGSFQSD